MKLKLFARTMLFAAVLILTRILVVLSSTLVSMYTPAEWAILTAQSRTDTSVECGADEGGAPAADVICAEDESSESGESSDSAASRKEDERTGRYRTYKTEAAANVGNAAGSAVTAAPTTRPVAATVQAIGTPTPGPIASATPTPTAAPASGATPVSSQAPTQEPTQAPAPVSTPASTTAPTPAATPVLTLSPTAAPELSYAANGWQPESAAHCHGNGADAGICPACGLIYGSAGGTEGQYGAQDGVMG